MGVQEIESPGERQLPQEVPGPGWEQLPGRLALPRSPPASPVTTGRS